MSKMYCFSNKFSKITYADGSPPLASQYWWPDISWFGQIVDF